MGTAAAPIRFLGEQAARGFWRGLQFWSASAANELTWVEVAHGGGGGGTSAADVWVLGGGRLRLTNSLLRESAGWGLFVDALGIVTPTPVASGGNSFSNNTLGPSNIP